MSSPAAHSAQAVATLATPREAFVTRRRALGARLGRPALVCAGERLSRNYRANQYPFRATSHFLYFVGASIPRAVLFFEGGEVTLFAEAHDPDDALWHGPAASFEELRLAHGFDAVRSLAELEGALAPHRATVAVLPPQDAAAAQSLARLVGRTVSPCGGDALTGPDAELADAMIALRLRHDAAALAQLRRAGQVSAEAHLAGMRATRPGVTEHAITAAMLSVLRRAGMDDAYGPIVSVHGEVLHNERHDGVTAAGDLLLADVGGETAEGWAGDITRVWPVSGRYSSSQRAIYDVVLGAQRAAIDAARAGTRYRAVHEAAKRAIVTGLCDLGIFRGDVDGLLERGAAAIFFPHGIGHLLGLDVHDMEDLGDRAGYAPGRTRSQAFGDGYLRLDRDLEPGMVVTIEPGFYQVPAILGDARFTGAVGRDLDRDRLAKFADVRGIRIEDDVLVTADGPPEILTQAVPKDAAEVEALVGAG
ncbi:MAG: aminopeptidase P family protein [Myxococcales bacterium]|nr:aminopeptidase P family protein [Myxococcales bacterium]